jgi:hypothetical protein
MLKKYQLNQKIYLKMSTTGKINVQTENIFPIIKKFLYSDNEIFLRELVSNATDATQKLKALTSMGEAKGELGDLFDLVDLLADLFTALFIDPLILLPEIDSFLTLPLVYCLFELTICKTPLLYCNNIFSN